MNTLINKINKHVLFLLCGLLMLLSSLVWTRIYLDSQNYLLRSPNWHSFKSFMVDNYVIAFETAMSRNTLGGNEIDLRGQVNADIILHNKNNQLKELSFNYIVPNNSYIDVHYDFLDSGSSFFRISKSSLYSSGFYTIDKNGKYSNVIRSNYFVASNGSYRGMLRESDMGIEFWIDGKSIAINPGAKFKLAKFGFESGIIGAIISKVKVVDSSNQVIDTSFYNKTGSYKIYLYNLFLIIMLIFLKFFIRKENLKSLFYGTLFIFLLGILWLTFDHYYYSKISTSWNYKRNSTYFTTTHENHYDFETFRFQIVKFWGRILGETSISFDEFEKKYGKVHPSQGADHCFKNKCGHREAVLKENPSSIKIGLVGQSMLASVLVSENETTTFLRMYQQINEDFKGLMDIETFNYSTPSIRMTENGEDVLAQMLKDKINIIILQIKIHKKETDNELNSFFSFIKKCKAKGISVFLVNNPVNPERILFQTDYQVADIASTSFKIQDKYNQLLSPWMNLYIKEGLVLIEPGEVFFNTDNIKKGKIWWDKAHLTSYGHELFGAWIGKKIGKHIRDNHEK